MFVGGIASLLLIHPVLMIIRICIIPKKFHSASGTVGSVNARDGPVEHSGAGQQNDDVLSLVAVAVLNLLPFSQTRVSVRKPPMCKVYERETTESYYKDKYYRNKIKIHQI